MDDPSFWHRLQFAFTIVYHNQMASVVTASFVVAAVGARYTLRGVHKDQARLFLQWGTGTAIPRFERISASLRRFSRCGVPEYASLFQLLVP